MKKRKKISLVKYRVANLSAIFGGNDVPTNTPTLTQTEDKKSRVIVYCPKPGDKSKNGGMGCPNGPQMSNNDTSPCN